MKPLNTSHSEISFGGILQPLVDLLARNPRQNGKLSGQEVVIPRKDVQAIIALDGENDVHLLITPAPADDSRLSKLDLKGLKITSKEWAVAGRPVQHYLDISCATGTLPSFRRPFLRFAEDVLFEVTQSEYSPADAVYRTSIRWRKFWSPDIETEITRDWVHGIFGELLFLADLIQRHGSKTVGSWAGPTGKDHDFQIGTDLAVEVKTSVETPFRINCNIRQLDHSLFKQLFVLCYRITPSESGTSLPELVRHVERLMGDDEASLDKFYELLMAGGYARQLESAYAAFKMDYSNGSVFRVDENFPKIIERSFVTPPDHRITGIRYTLQLTGLEELKLDDIADTLEKFAR